MRVLFRRTILATFVAMIIASAACLERIDDATVCPGEAVYTYCTAPVMLGPGPGGAEAGADGGRPEGGPGVPAGVCVVTLDSCIRGQRECDCNTSTECKRTASSCYPAPDCPPAVRAATPGAQCVAAVVSARPSMAAGGPSSDAGPGPPCICGCSSCAEACDGKGPVIGPNQAVSVNFAAGRSSGRFGVLVRARGAGRAVVALTGADRKPSVFGTLLPTAGNFTELFPGGDALYKWESDGRAPISLDIRTEDDSFMEIDCIVPFVAP